VKEYKKMFLVKQGTVYSDSILDLNVRMLYTGHGDQGNIPFYGCGLFLAGTDIRVGSIVLRIGDMMASEHFYYDGHIGYRINEEYRGRGFAVRACKLVSNLAKLHEITDIFITCNVKNTGSKRVIEKIGAEFIEIHEIPEQYLDEDDKSNKRYRYKWKIA
jgi:predicted acetyltransferase